MTDTPLTLPEAIEASTDLLLSRGELVDPGKWQGVPTVGHPDLQTREVIGLYWSAQMPDTLVHLREEVKPNLPWADEHFAERISRVPSNPGEAYKNWPWWTPWTKESAFIETDDPYGKFTHTYQERMWPKEGGHINIPQEVKDKKKRTPGRRGIWYEYGDLDDVVNLLAREPHTRQAYLPIFFPEDTGAVHGGRIPCSIGYHFLLRDNRLHCFYTIRSCDLVRHFRDDIYLAVRLAQWVLGEVQIKNASWSQMQMGTLYFSCHSFHVHRGDLHHVHR